ncbi:hypothetical protein ACFVJS_20400 [Nocardioides sp. NPDC057772]|uniref:hypothetical protein n=1 Tax=Nocardioides sp. NPDC057772 TaxID=3346245 RepID=UPI00366FEB8B
MKSILIPAVAVAAAVVLTPSSAAAADGREFGHHVVHCAQGVGFDGTHNPGMHRGFRGFATHHVCVMA